MPASFAQIVKGFTDAELFAQLKTKLNGKGLPTIAWGSADPQQVMLEHGFAPLLATLYGYASAVAQGGLLRLAVRMAELDPEAWEADPDNTFLGWLARDRYAVVPLPPAYAEGSYRFTNSTGAAIPVPAGAAFQTPSGLVFRLTTAVSVPANAQAWGTIRAEKTGEAYNVAPNTVTRFITTIAGLTGSNLPLPPSTDWIVVYGGRRQRPAQVEALCLANWGRLAVLQTAPADAYRALALNARLTGVDAVRKVAVWGHFDADTMAHAANTVSLFLAGDAGPVTALQASKVEDAMRPYIGLHDKLKCRPCGTAAYAPVGAVKVASLADVGPVGAALTRQAQRLQQRLQIGQTVRAWDVRDAVGDQEAEPALAAVRDFQESLTDHVPVKSSLVSVSFANLSVGVI